MRLGKAASLIISSSSQFLEPSSFTFEEFDTFDATSISYSVAIFSENESFPRVWLYFRDSSQFKTVFCISFRKFLTIFDTWTSGYVIISNNFERHKFYFISHPRIQKYKHFSLFRVFPRTPLHSRFIFRLLCFWLRRDPHL